jgi:hypothetical protein
MRQIAVYAYIGAASTALHDFFGAAHRQNQQALGIYFDALNYDKDSRENEKKLSQRRRGAKEDEETKPEQKLGMGLGWLRGPIDTPPLPKPHPSPYLLYLPFFAPLRLCESFFRMQPAPNLH